VLVTADGSGLFPLLVCLLFVAGAILIATMIARSGRRRQRPGTPPSAPPQPADPYAQISTDELSDRANAALVAADNALKTSEQELGFAQAQYGAQATGPFAQALEASRADIAEAFRIRQRLDDDVPEDEPTRRAMLREVLDRCAVADRRLDAQAEAFDRLRALESQVDTLLPELAVRRDRATARLAAARTAWPGTAARYADGALAPVADNVSQAADRLAFAGQELDGAAAAERGAAAVLVRGAEQALGQADALLDALDQQVADLDAAKAAVPALIADVQADAAAARAARAAAGGAGGVSGAGGAGGVSGSDGVSGSGGDQIALAAAVARADQVVADAKADLASARPDPISALRRLEGVAGELGVALGGLRDAATRVRHAREQLDQAMVAARSTVDSAVEFITNRRGAVGAQARTRVAEAQRRLAEATAAAGADPVGALAAARSAQTLAEQATAAARDDVTRWSTPGAGGYGGSVVIGGGGLAGAVLGGILLDGMLGGAPRGGARMRRFAGGDGAGNGGNGPVNGDNGGGSTHPGRFGGPSTWTRDLSTTQ